VARRPSRCSTYPATVRSLLLLALIFSFARLLSAQQVRFDLVSPQVVRQRLDLYQGNDLTREASLKHLFLEAGCDPQLLTEQPVAHLKEPNLICVLPGKSSSSIVVGAHYDHVSEGSGVVDNWSGASLLPSLLQAIRINPLRHTYIFVAFFGEEKGLVGSDWYVQHLSPDQRKQVVAMVNMDTLGLGNSEIWVSHSDPYLAGLMTAVAHLTGLPLTGMNVENVGESDEESFRKIHLPTVTVHSLTSETLSVLHSRNDTMAAIKFAQYYDTYHLVSGYLSVLDVKLP
jgi:Iap family predicted aminopeptidase